MANERRADGCRQAESWARRDPGRIRGPGSSCEDRTVDTFLVILGKCARAAPADQRFQARKKIRTTGDGEL